jgi:hypothetical protein
MNRRLIVLKRDIGRSRSVLRENGIIVYRLQENFDGELLLSVPPTDFDQAQQLLTAAGVQVTHTR